MTKRILSILIIVLSQFSNFGQNHCKWSQSVKKINANEYDLIFKVSIEKDWFISSINQIQDSLPNPTKIWLDTSEKYLLVDKLKETIPIKYFETIFNAYLLVHQNNATFTQRVRIKERKEKIEPINGSVSAIPKIRVKKEEKVIVHANVDYQIFSEKHKECNFPPTLKLDFEILLE